ncbi:phosphoribosylformylglycinamidine synthase subunit PurQ [Thermoflavimicrobium daqui]|jgi:phosphoribosylformylglycinamidine synthase|uniref:Phosphoribosylformylglycinamidine synthase subunit PurQ n=1 Tax=Thermoflavimicrobium daqui TaxID=2137476 RepID=A0A364K1A2_9BACL|nr:phosphoribosylformylglycinamidine synthase subunit PurQ [Thermoflavimicrobium daqui]RAL21461.1 phosphoribosylformylglycinamidine synthase I [Thermoflavimicrobium daqui]
MHFAVPIFPGSNCDRDTIHAIEDVLDQPVTAVWHQDSDLKKFDAIIIPGGFSYGDYLRTGALAAQSPIMEGIREAADQGKLVLGICNGFQILLETGLLPGAMRRNDHLQFRCSISRLSVENTQTPFTLGFSQGEQIRIPIAHIEGNYYCDEETLQELQQKGQIIFRYAGENPNGSIDYIAGICNERRNVLGMMPHPERAIFDWMGSTDGVKLFTSMLQYWKENNGAA